MNKFLKYLIGAFVTAVIIFCVWYLREVVIFILVSAVLALIGKPIVNLFLKIKIKQFSLPKWFASLMALTVICSIVVLLITLFVPIITSYIESVSKLDMGTIIASFDAPIQSVQNFLKDTFRVSTSDFSLREAIEEQLSPLLNNNSVDSFLSSTFLFVKDGVIAIFSILFITFFFLKEDQLFYNMVVALFPTKYEEQAKHAMSTVTTLLIRYFTGIFLESIILTTTIASALFCFGFPIQTSLFMGMIVGSLIVIPYIGAMIGTIICVMIGMISPIEGHQVSYTIVVIISTVAVIKATDMMLLQPALYSKSVNAHPLEIFLVLLMAGYIGGVLGVFLAIPSYNVIRVFAKEFFFNFKLVQKLTENL